MSDSMQLLQQEEKYNKDLTQLYWVYICHTDSFSLTNYDDFLMAIASMHLMQQILSEQLAVSYVGHVAQQSLDGANNFPVDGLTRAEFVKWVGTLTQGMSAPPGRDFKLPQAAARAWDLATMPDACCLKLSREVFESWVVGSHVAWPTPRFDVLDFFAAMEVCEAVNGNESTGYMRWDSKKYPLRTHERMFWFVRMLPRIVNDFPNKTPMNMRQNDIRVSHVVCGCPSCPSGNECDRAECDKNNPHYAGRCPLCIGRELPCDDRCHICTHAAFRCVACEKRRRSKPRGCPSNGERQGYDGFGCSDRPCQCLPHTKCICMKCQLGVKVAELLMPRRELHVMRIDAADISPNPFSDGPRLELDTVDFFLQEGSAMRALVKEAKGKEKLCEEHLNINPWTLPEEEICTKCLVKKSRPESWKCLVDRRSVEIHSCALPLCISCTSEVYGISKKTKHTLVECTKCSSAMMALVNKLASIRIDQFVSLHVATEAPFIDYTTMPLSVDELEQVKNNCLNEYLTPKDPNHKVKLSKTCVNEDTLASFKRADTSKTTGVDKNGKQVAGSYDTHTRGKELSFKTKMQYVKPPQMATGDVVMTAESVREEKLGVEFEMAANHAAALFLSDALMNQANTPRFNG